MKRVWALVAILALLPAACGDDDDSGGGAEAEGGGGSIRVALGDIESVETLALFIAMERVRKRGTDVELVELADEDLANQAVVGGQADVGLGAPYGLIQEAGAPLRIVCQLQRIRFFAVADKAAYPDWQSLDGETFTVHSRGSTTEALANIIQEEEGIEFGEISYVPGAEVRATALLRGNVKAAVLDIPNKNFVMSEAPGKFHSLLPPELEEELLPYYEQAAEEGLFTQDCGGETAAQEDFEFYNAAGQLEGDPADLQVEDFWSLEPLESALSAVEESGN